MNDTLTFLLHVDARDSALFAELVEEHFNESNLTFSRDTDPEAWELSGEQTEVEDAQAELENLLNLTAANFFWEQL